MYCEHFGLRCRPFEDRVDPQFTYVTAELEESLAALEYEVRYGRGIAMVIGEAGTGKTQLVRTLMSRLSVTDHVVVIAPPSSGEIDMLREACKGYSVTLPASATSERAVGRLRKHLARGDTTEHRSILIIDQAENLSADNIAQIATLNGMEGDRGRLITIILVGQPRLGELLERSEFDGFRQQVFGARTLALFSPTDTSAYIRHRLQVAGAGESDVFDADAMTCIHDASRGVARVINQFCNAAMLAAYAAGELRITRAIAAEVTQQGSLQRERAVPAQDVGVSSANELADGILAGAGSVGHRSTRGHAFTAPMSMDVSSEVPYAAGSATAGMDAESLAGGFEDGPSDWEASYPGGVDPAQGQVVDRLERALARAERIAATTEASLAQFQAIEKHLAALTGDARCLISGLGHTIERGRDSLEQVDQRLVAVLDRAERSASEVDASSDRCAAIADEAERRGEQVERASDQARDVEDRVTNFAKRLAERIDDVQERTTYLVESLESSQETKAYLDAATQRASATITQLNEASDTACTKIQTSIEDVERSQQRLANTKFEGINKQLDAATQRASVIITQLNEATDTACTKIQTNIEDVERSHQRLTKTQFEGINKQLDAATQRASVTITQLNEATDTACTKIQTNIEDVERSHQRLAKTQFEEMNKQLVAATQRASATITQLNEDTDTACTKIQTYTEEAKRAHGSFVETHVQEAQDRLKKVAAACECSAREVIAIERTKLGELEQSANRITVEAKQRIDDIVATTSREHESDIARRIDILRTESGRVGTDIEAIERRQHDLDAASKVVHERVTATAGRIARTEEVSAALDETLTKLTGRADTARGQLIDAIEQGENLVSSVHSVRGKVEEIQQNVSAALFEVGRTSERVTVLRSDAQECERIAERISVESITGSDTAEELRKALAAASGLRNDLQLVVTQAAERLGQIDTQHTLATRILHDLGDANTAAQGTSGRLNDVLHASDEKLNEARFEQERLAKSTEDGQRTVGQLSDLVTSGGELHDALQGLVAHSDEKITRLDSHHAAVRNVLGELTEVNKSAHDLVKRTVAATSKVERTTAESTEKINGLLQDVWSLTAKTEVNTVTLSKCNDRAAELIPRIERLTDPSQSISAEIAKHIEKADLHTKKMTEGCQQAAKLVDRLSGITRLLDSATEVEESVRTTTAEVQATHDVLAATIDEAVTHSAELQKLNSVSHDTVKVQTQSTDAAQSVVRKLSERVADAHSSIETADRLLGGFLEQAEALGEQLQALNDRTAQIDERVSQSSCRSDEMVKSAATQAAHLERVCATVRRVFAGISQATTEAREQTRRLQVTGHDANERLSTLNGQTSRAAGVLREWVEEAVRVQTRLEHTLRLTPSIHETLTTDALMDLSRSAQSVASIDDVTMTPTNASIASAPADTTQNRETTGIVADKSATRANLISRMIEQAKKPDQAKRTTKG